MPKPIQYKTITKSEFAENLGISPATRRRWLNDIYFEELKELNYQKTQKYLFPKQLEFLYNKLVYTENENI